MQFVIVTIRRNMTGVGNTMLYPAEFNAQAVQNASGGPQIRDGGIGNGQATEEMLMRIDDALATTYDASTDMRIVTQAEADTWLGNNPRVQEMPEERVTDVDRIALIQAKQSAGISLSPEDLDALDPDKPIRGVNRITRETRGLFKL